MTGTKIPNPIHFSIYLTLYVFLTITNNLWASLSYSRLIDTRTPESIRDELESFCRQNITLRAFYTEVYERNMLTVAATPHNSKNSCVGSKKESIISSPHKALSSSSDENSPACQPLHGIDSLREFPNVSAVPSTSTTNDSIGTKSENP